MLIIKFCSAPAVPEGVPAPLVADGAGGTVLVSWMLPTAPNGIILRYYVERAPLGDGGSFTQICLVEASASRVFVDTSTLPFTGYKYRIVAENGAGLATGPATEFTTPEAGKRVYSRQFTDVLPYRNNNTMLQHNKLAMMSSCCHSDVIIVS